MDELIKQLLARDLADFEGLEVRGSVPVTQELMNNAITAFLQDESATLPGGQGAKSDAGKEKLRLPLPLLQRMVRKAQVRFVEGKMIFDFEIRR